MEAIQVQTPPKDDDLEMPELSVPPEDSEIDDSVDEEEEPEPIAVEGAAEEAEPVVDTRDDEIVVEDEDVGQNEENRNGNEDGESGLSSAPDSDAEPDTSKTGDPFKVRYTYSQLSKSGKPKQLG